MIGPMSLCLVPNQPATRFTVPYYFKLTNGRRVWVRGRTRVRHATREILTCRACGRRRRASNLVVQAFEFDVRFLCRETCSDQ